ncbi:hypothetical protein AVEN_86716-1 [Araneus ventricosus]|uniref:Reverse transcriptase domain-containing protein n=1 Tax=Araneus ventricosus TaxID=182803 RepID=A0A4Y2HJ55_ARAVE|nr:hypothetical protein AVEN_86716-1 [Araneus ventricosus]
MERLVVNRLNWYFEEYGILAVEQAGFHNHRSTCDQVTQFSQFVKEALDDRNILTAIYIDFKGAYDSVWREKLYQKLLSFGITSNLFNWIKSFTSQRTCRVLWQFLLQIF